MVRYSFPVRLFHSRLHAGLSRRSDVLLFWAFGCQLSWKRFPVTENAPSQHQVGKRDEHPEMRTSPFPIGSTGSLSSRRRLVSAGAQNEYDWFSAGERLLLRGCGPVFDESLLRRALDGLPAEPGTHRDRETDHTELKAQNKNPRREHHCPANPQANGSGF
jgi:hypothetical protein